MAVEMRAIGLAVDDPMLYNWIADALPGEHEDEVRQLTGRTDLGRETMCTIRELCTHVPKSQKNGAHDHASFGGNPGGHAGRVEKNGRNGAGGVMAAAAVAKTKYPRAVNLTITEVQAERTRNPLIGRTRNADVRREDTSDPSVKRSSAKDAEEPGTGLTFAHP